MKDQKNTKTATPKTKKAKMTDADKEARKAPECRCHDAVADDAVHIAGRRWPFRVAGGAHGPDKQTGGYGHHDQSVNLIGQVPRPVRGQCGEEGDKP